MNFHPVTAVRLSDDERQLLSELEAFHGQISAADVLRLALRQLHDRSFPVTVSDVANTLRRYGGCMDISNLHEALLARQLRSESVAATRRLADAAVTLGVIHYDAGKYSVKDRG